MTKLEATPQTLSALIRTTLFVQNRYRAKAFYCSLGFSEVYYEGVLAHPSASQVLGLDNAAPYPISILKMPGPNMGMIGLFELPSHTSALPVRKGPAYVGESAQIFYVANFDTVLPALKAAGATWLPEPVTFELAHFSHREVCLRDPDGFLLNLIERDPSAQYDCEPEVSFTLLDSLI